MHWVSIRNISDINHYKRLLEQLDPGEAEAIILAIELSADILLIDEKKGRKIARKYGLMITGLLGILMNAKSEGLIDNVKPILDRLIFEIGFRISPKLYQEVLDKVNE